jgi:transposase
MDHVAIDWGTKESQICVRADSGEIIDARRVRTAQLAEYLARRPPSRVVIETSVQSFAIADQARQAGHEVRVVPATLVRLLGVGERRTKTDRRDAEALSRASCRIDLPSVHIPSTEARQRKAMCASRDALIRTRTLLVNAARAALRADGRSVRGTPDTLPARLRTVAGDKPPHLLSLATVLETLNTEIQKADRALVKLAKSDELCRRLMAVPGVGPVTAVRFKAAIDDVSRFPTAHALQSYLGLVPGEYSSSERQHRLGITKAGPASLRTALVQAAWSARRCRRQPLMVHWSLEVEKRRGKRVAVVAMARKLAGVLFAMWRNNTEYDPTRA